MNLDFSIPGFPRAGVNHLQGGRSLLGGLSAQPENAASNWIGPFQQQILTSGPAGSRLLRVIADNGNAVDFQESANGFTSHDLASRMQVTELLGAQGEALGWRVRLPNDQEELYNAAGRLVQLIDTRSSQVWTVDSDLSSLPTALVNHQGRRIELAYENSLLSAFTDPNGARTEFDWHPRGRLLAINWPDGSQREYRYESTASKTRDALTAVIDEAGNEYARWDYHANGLAKSSEHASGTDRYTFSYSISSGRMNQATVISPLGVTEQFAMVASGGVRRAGNLTRTCSTCTSATQAVTYSDGLISTQTDFRGHQTSYTYDHVRDLERVRIEAKNRDTTPTAPFTDERKTETDWHPNWRVATERRTYACAAPNTSAQPCNTETNTRWTLKSRQTYAVNPRGQLTASCRIDPAIPAAMAYVCGSQANAPAGVRQSRTEYCNAEDADFGSASCPFEGYVKTIDGPRTDVVDVTVRTYFDADHASCASSPTTCPWRKGDLRYLDNALGQRSEFLAYDGAGRLLRQRDPNGQITDLSYHPRGWLIARAVRANADGTPNAALDAVTRLEYEPYGDIKRVIQPDDSALEYCRDPAHRITAVVQTSAQSPSRCDGPSPMPGSEAIVYTLDAAGNRVREEVRDGSGQIRRLLARQYNQLGQLRAAVNAPWADQPDLDDPAVKKTRYTYDANGNQDLSTDPLDRVADNDYDPLNRLIRSIQDQGSGNGQINASVRYEYDARDNLRKVIDPKNLSTEYVYDGLDNQTQLISPDTGSTLYTFDAAGNRKSQTDARGVQSLYSYDALNRLVSIAYPADPTKSIAFVYDQSQPGCAPEESFALGRLTRIDDASGSTTLCHDRRGNLKRKLQSLAGQTLSVQYRHDRADRLTGITYPSGLELHTPRDAHGRVQQVQLQRAGFSLALVNGVDWLPFGPIKAIHFGHGETLAKDYDRNYWPQAITSPAVDYQFSTDAVGNIVAIDSSQEGGQRYAYDRLDRLESVRDVNLALIESYTYDATGNRTSHTVQTASGPQTVTYGYPSSSHRLEAVDGQPRTFDPAGNTLSGIPTYDGAQAVYDVRNRLSEIAVDPSQVRQRNNYNGRGERVLSARPQTTPSAPPLPQSAPDWTQDGLRGQIYDESGQLLSTLHGGSELRFEEVIWLDNTPIARVLSNASGVIEVHAIHSDHLNTPRALTHAQAQSSQPAGTVVWRWQLVATNPNPQPGLPASNTFGALMADSDPDGNGTSVRFDLRFPGQQYDGESGLHYNYFRDYEAATGRYVESDPIGLFGGLNTFSYAYSSPVGVFDPDGRAAQGLACFGGPLPCVVVVGGSIVAGLCAVNQANNGPIVLSSGGNASNEIDIPKPRNPDELTTCTQQPECPRSIGPDPNSFCEKLFERCMKGAYGMSVQHAYCIVVLILCQTANFDA